MSGKPAEEIIAFERLGERVQLNVPFDEPRGVGFRSTPSEDHEYLVYLSWMRDMGQAKNWPITTWRVNLENMSQKKTILPIGPWVGDTKERFQCFSCGCGCYRDVAVSAMGSDIFLHVYGIGFSARNQGIYRLDSERNGEWEQIIKGPVNGKVVISPDGCKIAYSTRRAQVVDLCKQN